MTKQALNDWAIMNLSMEDRGQQPVEPEPAARGQPAVTAAGSFLTGELSYFGVCLHYRKPSAAPLFHTVPQISTVKVIAADLRHTDQIFGAAHAQPACTGNTRVHPLSLA